MKIRGEVVRAAIEKSGMNKTDVAKRIGVSRQALYDWFDIPNLGWDKIFRIGKVIKHDFADDFPELKKPDNMIREPMVTYSTPENFDECQRQLNDYKEKYIRLMEDNQILYKEIVALRSGESDSPTFGARAV